MTPDPIPLTGCPRCSRSNKDTVLYAVGAMGAAASFARMHGHHKLAAELRHAYCELMLLAGLAAFPADDTSCQRRAA